MALSGESHSPRLILIFSGKRKSGKDYVTDMLQKKIGSDKCAILRLSEPLKSQYAKEHGLCLDRLLDSSSYKETYRADMIQWGEEKRNKDAGYFIRIVANGPGSEKPIWIISDARRKTDISYIVGIYGKRATTIRVTASEEVRTTRGWRFSPEVDNAESECDLDSGIDFHITISNDGNEQLLEKQLSRIVNEVEQRLKSDQ